VYFLPKSLKNRSFFTPRFPPFHLMLDFNQIEEITHYYDANTGCRDKCRKQFPVHRFFQYQQSGN
jgi:hypothetical protein